MKLTIDTDNRTLTTHDTNQGETQAFDLYGPEAFALLSRHWIRTAWAVKHSYSFSWLGRPIIQLPEDLVRLQEVVYQSAPDVIVETGIAHGGSLIFYAGLCKLLGRGRVIGIDVEIRAHNRAALDAHQLRPLITLIEGSSTAPAVLEQVRALIQPGEHVMVSLDSNHTYQHVADELRAYADIVTPGMYLLVQDGIMYDLTDVPGGAPTWTDDNPTRAALEFVAEHPEFAVELPTWEFNESRIDEAAVAGSLTHWPSGWLKRRAT